MDYDFYGNQKRGFGSSLYPEAQSFDVRDEMHALLYGDVTQPGIGRPVLVRRLKDQKCSCFKDESGAPRPSCGYCQGEGFLFTEDVELAFLAKNYGDVQNPTNVIKNENFLAQYGFTDENRSLAFFLHTAFPNYERYLKPEHPSYDSLYELKVDDQGILVTPWVRTAKWKIRSVTPQHGDWGRIEFFVAGLEKESL